MKYHVKGRPLIQRHVVEAWQAGPGSAAPEGWWWLEDYNGDRTFVSPGLFERFYEPVGDREISA